MVIFFINKWFIVPNIGWFLGVKESIILKPSQPSVIAFPIHFPGVLLTPGTEDQNLQGPKPQHIRNHEQFLLYR